MQSERGLFIFYFSYKAVGELSAPPPVVFDYAAPPGFGIVREKWDKTVKVG